MHPRLSGVAADDPAVEALVDEVAARTSLLLMHTVDRYAAHNMARYGRKHPELNIILGHAGHSDSDAVAEIAAAENNVYLEFCCEWPGSGKIERALGICGPEKIVFGSDSDLLDPAFTGGMFKGAGLDETQARLVYRDNAARLLQLPA